MMGAPNAEAVASYRYRLREASRLALEIGDRLLELSQNATDPNPRQLSELRELETSLDINLRLRVEPLKP